MAITLPCWRLSRIYLSVYHGCVQRKKFQNEGSKKAENAIFVLQISYFIREPFY